MDFEEKIEEIAKSLGYEIESTEDIYEGDYMFEEIQYKMEYDLDEPIDYFVLVNCEYDNMFAIPVINRELEEDLLIEL